MEMVQYPDLLWYLTIIPWVLFFDLENNIKGQYYCKIPRTGYVVICSNESQQVFCNVKGTFISLRLKKQTVCVRNNVCTSTKKN